MKTNTKRIIATLLVAITYLVIGPYFFDPSDVPDLYEASEILPFIIFCIIVYVVIFGLWDAFKEKGILKVLGIIILVIFWMIFTNLKQINASLFCTNNPDLPLCSRAANESEVSLKSE